MSYQNNENIIPEIESKIKKYQEMLGQSQAIFIMSMSERVVKHFGQEKLARPDSYSDLDNKGFMGGGHASVIAAAEIGQYFPDVKLVTTSAPEKTEESLAKIYAKELERLGISENQIMLEEKSNNLLTEIIEMIKIAYAKAWENLAILTNENQVARARAMIDNLNDLAKQLDLNDKEFSDAWQYFENGKKLKINFIAAEEILPLRDSRYIKIIEKMRESENYKKRVEAEERGARKIREGTYGRK